MKNKKYYILSFIIPCIMMILLYISVGVIGGNKSILTVDLADQYVAFFNSLKNILNGTINPIYSFSKTLGGNLFGIITYYLMSPLNLIIVFFNRIDIPNAILIINILKIALCGLTSYIYFSKTNKDNKTNLAFSIIYSMMSYNIVYSQNIMWLDGVILLPIIFLGIERLIEKKPTLFYISLTTSIICNYYIGYMSCIGSLIYFIYKDYLKENKIVIKNILNFIKYIILSVLTSSIILIPSIISLLSGKANGILKEFIPNQKFALFDLITRFYIGTFKNKDLEGGCPNIYISLIAIVLVIYYFYNKKVSTKEKKASLILLSVFIISFIFNPIDVIWHTFKHPYGFPFRYSFIFDFILLLLAQKSLKELNEIDKKFIKRFIMYAFFLTLIVDKVLYTTTMYYKALATFILLLIYLFYLTKNKTIKPAIIILIIIELFINNFITLSNIKYQDKTQYENIIQKEGTIIDKLNKKENFYRLEKDYSYSTNDELLLNYNGISHFSSVYEQKNNELLGKYLGIFNRFYITNYKGSTPVTNSLFNIKYLLSKEQNQYYNKIDTYKDINIYENNYNLPIGFMVNEKLKDLKLEEYNPFENQNKILKTMNSNIENVFIKENFKIKLNNLKKETTKEELIYNKINKNESASIVFEINKENTGILYAYLSSKTNKKINIKLNGKSITDQTNQNDYYYNILELKVTEFEPITLEVELLEDTLKIGDYMFYTLDLNKFNNAINILKQNDKLEIINYDKNQIQAQINVTENNKILYTSIPYDKSIRIEVDGNKIEPLKTFDTLISLKLDKGIHTIKIKYELPGIKIGIILSIIGIVTFIIKRKIDRK